MIRAGGLPSAGVPRIGGSRGGGGNSSGRGNAMQRSTSPNPTMATKTRATSSDDGGGDGDGGGRAQKKTVIGLGSCGLDYLALVAAFPKPDDKLRTEKLEMQGGGNCANALTAAARLGAVQPFLVSRVGNDGAAEAIAAELERDGVSTRFLSRWKPPPPPRSPPPREGSAASSSSSSSEGEEKRAEGASATVVVPSPSTYIIVDREGGTRTCIHTPGPAFGAADLEEMMMIEESSASSSAATERSCGLPSSFSSLSSALGSASLVFFDGRLAEAALPLAEAARDRCVPILVEAERPREGLAELLERASFVSTSASFPGLALSGAVGTLNTSSSGEEDSSSSSSSSSPPPPHPGAAAAWLLASLPDSVRWVSTTLGARGAIILERRKKEDKDSPEGDENTIAAAEEDAASAVDAALASAEEARRRRMEKEGSTKFAARSSTGAGVGPPGVVSFDKRLKLPRRAASSSSSSSVDAISVRLYASTAASLPGPVVDSTGAGDAFNGALIHALASRRPRRRRQENEEEEEREGEGEGEESSSSRFLERTLALACSVAGCNCLGLGARGGLPRSAEGVSRELLL